MKQPAALTSRRLLVSVAMIAYNVEQYIEQSIRSVLAQDVDFPIELVIGEDRSTDRTREIVKDLAEAYPRVIRPIFRTENLGMNENFFRTFEQCRAPYVALLDGDDYWTDPHKLQVQVDYLRMNPDASVCFHNAQVVYEDAAAEAHPFHMAHPNRRLSARVPASITGIPELVRGNYLQTGSVMYRGGLVSTLPPWVYRMPTFDWPLHLLHAEKGQVHYIDRVMSVYRVRKGGFWSTNYSLYPTLESVASMIDAFGMINEHLGFEFAEPMRGSLVYLYERGLQRSLEVADAEAAARYARLLVANKTRLRRRRALGLKLVSKASALPGAALWQRLAKTILA